MRIRGRIDENQPEIVKALRQVGCSVALTSVVGNGFPDLVLGKGGKTLLLEIKNGSLPPSRQYLTREEIEFHSLWRGQIAVVSSIEAALALLKTEGLL